MGTPPNKMYVCYTEKQTGQKKTFFQREVAKSECLGFVLNILSCPQVLYKETQNTKIHKLEIDEKKGNNVGTLSEIRNKSNIKNALKIHITVLFIHKVNSLQFQLQANRCLVFDE